MAISASAYRSVGPPSTPTMASTPASPTSSPTTAVRLTVSPPGRALAMTAPTSGTPAISSAAVELGSRCSADAMSTQGDGHLDDRERRHPAPVPQDGLQSTAQGDDRQE